MPATHSPEVLDYLVVLMISVVAGFISIARRILQGHSAKILWIVSEGIAAILCGCLAHDAYPTVSASLPVWITQPVAVAFSAYVGSRFFQEAEKIFIQRYSRFMGRY